MKVFPSFLLLLFFFSVNIAALRFPWSPAKMSTRVALPLRLVQCDRGTATSSTAAAAVVARTQVLTPYKPCGLPCYAASQVRAVSGSGGGGSSSNNNSSADGRRLFAIHTRHTAAGAANSAASALSFEASAQPRPEDPSDSLLTRVIDTSLPGCRPYVALPVLSSLLRHGGPHTPPAATLNMWTGRHKGLVLVTHTPSDALFLRNAAQLDLVQQTYRVVCRLPSGAAAAVRRYIRTRQTVLSDSVSQKTGPGARGTAAAAALNPYLRAHAERQQTAQCAADLTQGIPLTYTAAQGGQTDAAHVAQLPVDVRPHPLVRGGFFDVARGLLRVQGTVNCFLRPQTPLHPASQQRVEQVTRLQNLFTAPPAAQLRRQAQATGTTNASNSVDSYSAKDNGATSCVVHPWVRPEWRIGVSLDLPNMQSVSPSSPTDENGVPHSPQWAPRGKSLAFDFRLLSLSPLPESELALYEVHTRGDVTADELAAVFHAEGLTVLNDYVQDVSLAQMLEEVAQRMRAAPPGLVSSLPMGLQHYLRSASAEELVARPLTLMPLEDADRLCIHALMCGGPNTGASSPSPLLRHHEGNVASPVQITEDDRTRMLRFVRSAVAGGATGTQHHPLHQLLWHALSSLHLANAEERRAYERVLSLTLGGGIECAGITFPDPATPATVHALQHVWLTYEQQRQRHAPLAEAARVARQHPLAAELRYVRRSVLEDSTGLTRVPLVEDLVRAGRDVLHGGSGVGAWTVARGECSFSHAVALTVPLKTTAGEGAPSSSLSTSATRAAVDAAETARTPHNTGAWALTEVPPSYAAACNSWMSTRFASAANEVVIVDAAAAAAGVTSATARTSLWPTPAELSKRSRQSSSASHLDQHSEADVATAAASEEMVEPAVRVFLRVEELAELSCAHCGALGHTWQHCGVRARDALADLDTTALTAALGDDSTHRDGVVALPANGGGAASASTAALSPAATSVMQDEGLFFVEDAAAALADQATALEHLREQRLRDAAGYDDSDAFSRAGFSASAVVPVPNVAATQRFKAAHVLRHEARKPAVHRRTVRCVYCGGYHHITACPKLQAQNSESFTDYQQQQCSSTLPLLCIKCGERGHVYTDCPKVPADLHPSTHCPICGQPRKSGSHDPLHCPRRVPVPAGYALSGIPHREGTSSPSLSSANRGAGAARPRQGSHDESSGVGRGGSTSGFARRRRRRGSVLIADSFVDSPSRTK